MLNIIGTMINFTPLVKICKQDFNNLVEYYYKESIRGHLAIPWIRRSDEASYSRVGYKQ